MSNQQTLQINLQAVVGGQTFTGIAGENGAVSGNTAAASVQNIATSATPIDFAAVTNPPGIVFLQNQDPTNFIQIDANNAFNGFPQKLLPGKSMILRPETLTIYAKADTGACLLYVCAIDP